MTGTIVLLSAPVLAGVGAGYAFGGRMSAIAGRLRRLWLLWLAVAVQAAQHYADPARALVEDRLGVPMLAVVFGLVLVWLVVNLRSWPPVMRLAAGVVLLGGLLNGSAIAANGRMPYSTVAARAVGLPANLVTAKIQPADERTRLALLGDVLPLAPVGKVVSAGDVLIGVGVSVLIAAAMRREPGPGARDLRASHADRSPST